MNQKLLLTSSLGLLASALLLFGFGPLPIPGAISDQLNSNEISLGIDRSKGSVIRLALPPTDGSIEVGLPMNGVLVSAIDNGEFEIESDTDQELLIISDCVNGCSLELDVEVLSSGSHDLTVVYLADDSEFVDDIEPDYVS